MSTRIDKPRKKEGPAPRSRNRVSLFATGAGILGVVAIAIWAGGKALIPESVKIPAKKSCSPEPCLQRRKRSRNSR